MRSCILAGLLLVVSAAAPLRASVITQSTGGTSQTTSASVLGQSFTTPGGGPWKNVVFNFFSDSPATTPYAIGTAYLFNSAYVGTPSALSGAAYLAASTGIVGGQYVFDSNFVLQPSTQYFLYSDTQSLSHAVTLSAANPYAGGYVVSASTTSANFSNLTNSVLDLNFQVSGTNVVPEPGSWGLLAIGFGALVASRRLAK